MFFSQSKKELCCFITVASEISFLLGSADTTNGQFWTGSSQNTGILPAGRISIREVTPSAASI
jgi:hypothetical protein